MATEVDICNAALSMLGCAGDIVSISPAEGGRFAERCAREYPICRNLVLESYDWSFAVRRASLACSGEEVSGWKYSYAKPADAVSVIAVLPPDDKFYEHPQSFIVEADPSTGVERILTDQEDAVCRYTFYCKNTARFTEKFSTCITLLLASRLAGNVIKGDNGMKVAASLLKQYNATIAEAKHQDMKQRRKGFDNRATWLKFRGWRRG